LAVTGGLTLDGAAGTSGQVMVSAGGSNTPTWGNAFVAGMIMLWSGSSASIPTGWLLCDGSSSTPDLRNRFVVGAGSTYAVGATGGSADAIVVSHTHTATVTDPGHNHGWSSFTVNADGGNQATGMFTHISSWGNTVSRPTDAATTGISVSNSTTGSSGTNANLPPYYALCYIMKA
jgi:microcystin-dependent protein